jgi:protease secretion system outer membrane protein
MPITTSKSDKFEHKFFNKKAFEMLRNFSARGTSRTLVAVAWAASFSTGAFALDLMADFQKAQTYDPAYQTALAERQANEANSTQALLAYMPTANINNQRIASDTSNRRTATVSQPVIDLARFATLRQSWPRQGFAESTFLAKQQDLTIRLLKAANAIVIANENLALNTSKIAALDKQALAAQKKLDLGQGTVTDLRDIEVKAAQAKAQQLAFKTALDVAAKQYAAITGEKPNVKEFVLENRDRKLALKGANEYVDLALSNSAALQAARFSERIAELEVERSTGSLAPVVSATYNKTTYAGVDTSYSGVVINMPLQADNFYARKGVQANYLKAKESTRDTEEKTRVDVERLTEQVNAGIEMLDIQRKAIASAELSLEANIKSYEGGVRSAVDILNATQTVFQVKSEYATSATAQAENLLTLLNQTSLNPSESLEQAYKYLFAR